MIRTALAVPRIFIGALLLFAIGVMLAGVFLRYIMVPVAYALNFEPINFFSVEETGETLLAWITLVGAAVGIAERTHFTVRLFTHYLPPRIQAAIRIAIHLVIATFGGVLAWQGWQVAMLNRALQSPALEISLAWLYGASVAGGALIVLYAFGSLLAPELKSATHQVVE